MKRSLSSGFTLIEVLVASVILFSTITAVTLLYRGAVLSSTKATRVMQITNVMPIAAKQIGYMIRKKTVPGIASLSGSNQFWGVGVKWTAHRIDYRSAPAIYDFDNGQDAEQPKKYSLWAVNVTFSINDYQREYQFKQVSWNEK
ncbi:hypothetical protein PSECIP111951_00674 [Pseudoalteromonas holothuriae]|uniref:Prepilin-type N-terminal cleavage/methylation domain-containing protein n=1 Tax=Pseudoalteromonas holothuriae TaxID=2963714 RepID=A0ABM9GEG8_9GAMM|nr:prepilin-type N-terminal cleavage/methylation domain-containing protein [Pseudoalteromonas sp. CIP111951]CAH9052712.1 hypothetical protein PSECIP111951_00674 [Pseudoalteromonas sp. CIP111951]